VTAGRFRVLYHLALVVLFVGTGVRHAGYRVISVDELHPLLTARNILDTGSLYFTDGNRAVYDAFYPQWPLPVSRNVGRAYSFRGALPAVPLALLMAVARPLAGCHNLLALGIMLWVLHRLQLDWRVPAGRYYLAVTALVFGCAATAHWFTFFPYVLVGALLALQVYAYDRYCRDGRQHNLMLAALALTALIIARQEMIIIALVPLAALTWRRRHAADRRYVTAAAALAAALLAGGGNNLLFNYLNAGTWGNNGQGELHWMTAGLWRWLLEPNENPLLLNPWLLLAVAWRDSRRAWPYLLTALVAAGLYSCWWGWDSGYLRQLVPALMLATPLLLTMRVRSVTVVLVMLGVVANAAYFVVPYFDVYDVWQISNGSSAEIAEPLLPWQLLYAQAQEAIIRFQ